MGNRRALWWSPRWPARGGVGKTALAVHLAHQVRWRFPDGQLYVDLGGAGTHPADPRGALGVQGSVIPAGLQERAALYRTRLDGRHVLVVLDNAAGEGQIRPLLPSGPSCGVLMTSRVRLGGLEGAHLVDLDVLEHDEAVAPLGRIVGTDRVAADVLRCLGMLHLAQARPDQALSRLRRALSLAEAVRRPMLGAGPCTPVWECPLPRGVGCFAAWLPHHPAKHPIPRGNGAQALRQQSPIGGQEPQGHPRHTAGQATRAGYSSGSLAALRSDGT